MLGLIFVSYISIPICTSFPLWDVSYRICLNTVLTHTNIPGREGGEREGVAVRHGELIAVSEVCLMRIYGKKQVLVDYQSRRE